MTPSTYMIWFLAMAVTTFLLCGAGIVAASGYWTRSEREARAAQRRKTRDAHEQPGRAPEPVPAQHAGADHARHAA